MLAGCRKGLLITADGFLMHVEEGSFGKLEEDENENELQT